MALPNKILLNPNLFASRRTVSSAALRAGIPNKGGLPNNAVNLQEAFEYWISIGQLLLKKNYELLSGILRVTADSEKVTATLALGILTITVPEGQLYMIEFNGTNVTPNITSEGELKVVVNYSYDNDRNTTLNNLQKIQTAAWDYSLVDTAISESEYVSELGVFEIPRKIIGASSNSLTIVFEGLNLFNKWGISVIYAA